MEECYTLTHHQVQRLAHLWRCINDAMDRVEDSDDASYIARQMKFVERWADEAADLCWEFMEANMPTPLFVGEEVQP